MNRITTLKLLVYHLIYILSQGSTELFPFQLIAHSDIFNSSGKVFFWFYLLFHTTFASYIHIHTFRVITLLSVVLDLSQGLNLIYTHLRKHFTFTWFILYYLQSVVLVVQKIIFFLFPAFLTIQQWRCIHHSSVIADIFRKTLNWNERKKLTCSLICIDLSFQPPLYHCMHNFRLIHDQVHLPDCCTQQITGCTDCILKFKASTKAFASIFVCFTFILASALFPLQDETDVACTKSFPVTQITYKAKFF